MAPFRNPGSETPRARSGRWMWLCVLIAGGVLAAAALRFQQERAIAGVAMGAIAQGTPEVANIIKHLRTSELITSRVETVVRAQNADDNWFGSVVATVEAPARLSYGVDLTKLESSRLLFSPIGGVYSLRVPPPKRIATEVFTGQEKSGVELAGLRFRSLAGEAQLGTARTRLHEQALRMRVTGAELANIRENARSEIEQLVRRIVGESASVRVVFDDEAGTSVAAGE